MSLITRVLVQDAVYWPPVSNDDQGQPVYGDPVGIKCRWTDSVEEVLMPNGRTVRTLADLMVDRDVELGGVMRQGLVEDLDDPQSPFGNSGVGEIVKFDKLPNRRATEFLRTVKLGQPS